MRVSAPAPTPAPAAPGKAELRAAATAFEAMMLKQLLQAAMPKAEGQAADWQSMALDGFARDLATQQPIGLARLLETSK